MPETITLAANIRPNREMSLTLPADIPLGPAGIVVIVCRRATSKRLDTGVLIDSNDL